MNAFFKHSHYCLFLLLFLLGYSCNAKKSAQTPSPITQSEIRLTDEGYRIFLNGEPFYVKGAGVDKWSFETLASHGANSLRTWSTENGKAVLDRAQELGLKVMMGIWVGLERHGFNYDDEKAVQAQLESIRKNVMALKDHPALMIWGIGNELNLESTNPNVWNAVNDISEMIHEVDPYHLTTTSLSNIAKKDVDYIASRAPDLDFICTQMYAAIDVFPKLISESGYEGPVLVTEWGATGYWEVPKTEWGAPIENHSSKKADLYLSRYNEAILTQSQQVMGSFVFLWGQKQERTPTWFGMFLPNGSETESIDAMHYAWTGEWPENRTPRLHDFTLDGRRPLDNIKLKAGDTYPAYVDISDPDGDKLIYRWEIMRESTSQKTGGDAEYIPASLEGLIPENAETETTFTAPTEPGAYRLFIYVEDGNGHTAHANIPFWVER